MRRQPSSEVLSCRVVRLSELVLPVTSMMAAMPSRRTAPGFLFCEVFMLSTEQEIQHGDRVLVYDYRGFLDDRKTPRAALMRPATVVCRYGYVTDYGSGPCRYPDLVDVIFDHRPETVSSGHFTEYVEPIP